MLPIGSVAPACDRLTSQGFRSTTAQSTTQYRAALAKVLNSSEFVGAKQLREFLAYVGEAALAGKTQVDQIEIAQAVLGRGADFNPVDDSTVRKIGSLLRQRLDKYYQNEGAGDAIIISVPVRSYVPVFRERHGLESNGLVTHGAPAVAEAKPVGSKGHPKWLLWALPVLFATLGLAAGYALWDGKFPAPQADGEFRLSTVKGDFIHRPLDLPGSAIQIASGLGEREDLVGRLTFRPEEAGQQAGLLFFQDPDNYIKLTRQFLSRVTLEFGAEQNGVYAKPPGTFEFDPSGQDLKPIWLSIRRAGDNFEAYRSPDGEVWQKVGNTVKATLSGPGVKAAFYANRGRTDSKDVVARFDHVSHGLLFHDMEPGELTANSLPGWILKPPCAEQGRVKMERSALVFDLNQQTPCAMSLSRSLPAGDWTLQTKVDFVPSNGSAAGLYVSGTKGTIRLVRWDASGGSISVEYQQRKLISQRDFQGWPPIVLYLECRNGRLKARYARDDLTMHQLPLDVPVEELGTNLIAGLHAARPSWAQGSNGSQARFSWILQEVHHSSNYR